MAYIQVTASRAAGSERAKNDAVLTVLFDNLTSDMILLK